MSGYLYDDKVNIRDFIADEIVKSWAQSYYSSTYDKPIIHQSVCQHFDVKRLWLLVPKLLHSEIFCKYEAVFTWFIYELKYCKSLNWFTKLSKKADKQRKEY